MTRKMLLKKGNKVLPFEQNGDFYYKRAQRFIDSNNYIDALNFYRRAIEKEPDNLDYLLDLAEVFTEMNYYEESNQILFYLIQSREEITTECYFGLGCNFLGLQEYEKAKDCFEKYLELDPDGEFSDDADDLLDLLQNQELFLEGFGDELDHDSVKLYKMANKGKELLDRGEYRRAIRQLEKVLRQSGDLIFVKNNLSLAYFCNKQIHKAIEVSKSILNDFPKNIHANCNLALFHNELGDKEKAQTYYEAIMAFQSEDPEEIYKIAVTLCELKAHEEANRMLRRLLQYKPYDKKVLHYMAISFLNMNQPKEAIEIWNRIEKIDPLNTIAKYYKPTAREHLTNNTIERKQYEYHYQVPYQEIIKRVKRINELVALGEEEIRERWKQKDQLEALLLWGIELNDQVIKKAILNLVASFGDDKSEKILRQFLLRRSESDEVKKEALALLKQIGAKEPYIGYLNNDIVEVRVNVLNIEGTKIPIEYQRILDLALQKMRSRYDERYADEVISIWERYIKSIVPQLPKIYKREAWAAALEYYYCMENGIKTAKTLLCKIYNTSSPTLSHHYTKMKQVLCER